MAETLLKIENLTKEYEGQKILDGINLEVKQGDVLVVVGPSGCGKSTLLRCINFLEQPTAGSILFQGKNGIPNKRQNNHGALTGVLSM